MSKKELSLLKSKQEAVLASLIQEHETPTAEAARLTTEAALADNIFARSGNVLAAKIDGTDVAIRFGRKKTTIFIDNGREDVEFKFDGFYWISRAIAAAAVEFSLRRKQ